MPLQLGLDGKYSRFGRSVCLRSCRSSCVGRNTNDGGEGIPRYRDESFPSLARRQRVFGSDCLSPLLCDLDSLSREVITSNDSRLMSSRAYWIRLPRLMRLVIILFLIDIPVPRLVRALYTRGFSKSITVAGARAIIPAAMRSPTGIQEPEFVLPWSVFE